MIRLYYGQPNDFDRGWTIESLWKPHTKNGRFGGWPPALRAKVIIFGVYTYKYGTNRTSESRRSIMQNKFRWLQYISSQNAKFRSPFLLGKNGCRNVYNWTFGVEIFWNQRNYFCIIERRDRVTFTGSIGTIFGGTNPKNYDFSPKCRRPPPKSTIFGMGLS